MKRIYLTVLFTIYIYNVVLGFKGSSCFSFTWIGAGVSPKEENCIDFNKDNPHIPCIQPVLSSRTSEMWDTVNKAQNKTCELGPDNVCIRYTYLYNNAIVNASYFCGKVTKDLTTVVTSECYTHYTEGYAIEVCACKSRNNSMPCNSTIRNTYSILIIFMATAVPLFMYKIFNIL